MVFGEQLMEEDRAHASRSQPICNYKLQQVSAIRNYPSGVERVSARTLRVVPIVDVAKNGEADCSFEKENVEVPKVKNAKSVEGDSSNMSMDLCKADVNLASSSVHMQKAALTRRYPPLRTAFVSAIRDYPRFCGPHGSKIESLKGTISSENKQSVSPKNFDEETKPLKKIAATDIQEEGKHFCDEGASSKGKGIKLTGDTEERKRKRGYYSALFNGSKSAVRTKNSQNQSVKKLVKRKIVDTASDVTRNDVRETLRLYNSVYRKMLQEEEAKLKNQGNTIRRIDLKAAKILKEKGYYVNTANQILGSVPGVEVGDEFQYRIELTMVGLHRHLQGGIDFVKCNGRILASSIVASGGYTDDLDNADVLIYSGQGGNVMNTKKEPIDQKLKGGNLALKNSIAKQNPVRVIRGSFSEDGSHRRYVYDGLYVVEKYWQEKGPHGKLIFMYQLRRMPDQPELAWIEVMKSKKFMVRKGLCVDDISHGKEPFPICVVNMIDNEKPQPFTYITRMKYPDWFHPIPAEGCSCTGRCSDPEICSCAIRNGGSIPYNHNGAIVEAKSLVYECGPSCKCSSTCYTRVSQHGMKFQLEIFKTETRGWGVRSRSSIPSGSFICEYIGELLQDTEAEQRTGHDEYLFDIGNNFSDNSTLANGLSPQALDAPLSSNAVVEDGGFTIDAAQYGNVGRFINHSCSPNLYAQNVLYDHADRRIPHIMLFAAENIPQMQELTYHYNYKIDQVFDSEGKIKKKNCYCGSERCTGRMY